jgi:hypothetical protein
MPPNPSPHSIEHHTISQALATKVSEDTRESVLDLDYACEDFDKQPSFGFQWTADGIRIIVNVAKPRADRDIEAILFAERVYSEKSMEIRERYHIEPTGGSFSPEQLSELKLTVEGEMADHFSKINQSAYRYEGRFSLRDSHFFVVPNDEVMGTLPEHTSGFVVKQGDVWTEAGSRIRSAISIYQNPPENVNS